MANTELRSPECVEVNWFLLITRPVTEDGKYDHMYNNVYYKNFVVITGTDRWTDRWPDSNITLDSFDLSQIYVMKLVWQGKNSVCIQQIWFSICHPISDNEDYMGQFVPTTNLLYRSSMDIAATRAYDMKGRNDAKTLQLPQDNEVDTSILHSPCDTHSSNEGNVISEQGIMPQQCLCNRNTYTS